MRRRAILLMATIGAAVLLASGVALAETFTCDSTPPCYGTPEGDTITGTSNGETIYALGGSDDVRAGDGNDTIYGGKGDDRDLYGQGGSDTIYGQGGSDTIVANIFDTPGSADRIFGGGGNDSILADDGNVDIINCGKGKDQVAFDQALDTIKGCEFKSPS